MDGGQWTVVRIRFFRGTKESGSGERCWGAGERRRDSFSISFFSRNEWVHHADSLFVFTFFEERMVIGFVIRFRFFRGTNIWAIGRGRARLKSLLGAEAGRPPAWANHIPGRGSRMAFNCGLRTPDHPREEGCSCRCSIPGGQLPGLPKRWLRLRTEVQQPSSGCG